jgi:hypothetical protein
MARRSVDMHGMLLINFQRITFSEGDGWELVKVDLDYEAQALSDIRTATPTRLLLIVKRTPSFGTQSHHSTPSQLTNTRYASTIKAIASLREPRQYFRGPGPAKSLTRRYNPLSLKMSSTGSCTWWKYSFTLLVSVTRGRCQISFTAS